MEFAFRAYMNNIDVTDWISDIDLEHPRKTLYRQWTFRFFGWSAIEPGATWDLFASYTPETAPRAEVVARAGILPPDRERNRIIVAADQAPRLELRGYDFVWEAQRKTPRETIVVVPNSAYIVEEIDGRPVLRENSVAGALNRYDGPIGKYRVWTQVPTIHTAIKRLGAAAGIRVQTLFPNSPMIPTVIPPENSFWKTIRDLAAPWKPRFYFRASTNTLIILDPISHHYQLGGTLEVPKNVISRMDGAPIRRKRTRRILIRIPA